jgi:hypothetical protein
MPSVSDDEKRFLKAREASEVLLEATRAYVESVFCTCVYDRVQQKVLESFRQQCQCGNHDFTCESEILVRTNRCAKHEALEEDAYAKGPCLAKDCPGGLDCKHRFAIDFPRPIALGPKAPAGLPAPTVPCHCEAFAFAICTELAHRGKATWTNSDPAKWAMDHIEVAKVFMPTMGKLEDGQPCQEARNKTEMGHFDITCLFGLLLNAKSLLINPQHRELALEVLHARNHCLGHKALSKLSEDEFASFIAACVDWVKALQELTAQESEMQRVFETLSLLAKPETLPDILQRATNDVEEFMLAKFSSEMLEWSPLFDGDCFVAMVERNDVLAARVYLETSRPPASALDALNISPAKDLGQDGTYLGNGVLNFAAGRGYFEMVKKETKGGNCKEKKRKKRSRIEFLTPYGPPFHTLLSLSLALSLLSFRALQ